MVDTKKELLLERVSGVTYSRRTAEYTQKRQKQNEREYKKYRVT